MRGDPVLRRGELSPHAPPGANAAHDPRRAAGGDRPARAGSVRSVFRSQFRSPRRRRRWDRPVPREHVRRRRVRQREQPSPLPRHDGRRPVDDGPFVRSRPGTRGSRARQRRREQWDPGGVPAEPGRPDILVQLLSGPGVASSNDTAFFAGFPVSLAPIVREGDAAPGTSGAVFFGDRITSAQFTTMNRNGAVLFQSTLSGGDVVGPPTTRLSIPVPPARSPSSSGRAPPSFLAP